VQADGASGPAAPPGTVAASNGPQQYLFVRGDHRQEPRFDEAKYRRYIARLVFGSLLAASGISLLIASGIYAMGAAGFIAMTTYCAGEDDCRDEVREEERRYRIRAWITLGAAAASFGIGVPLIVTGAKGRRREGFRRGNPAAAERFQRGSVVVGVLVGENAGGLRLSLGF